LFILRASPEQFRTAWFLESLYTELVILLIVRTRRPLYRSKPGRALWLSSLAVALGSLVLIYLPGVQKMFSFVPLPLPVLAALLVVTVLYVAGNEVAKSLFYRRALA
jgi:Mg2+-importing ATPase